MVEQQTKRVEDAMTNLVNQVDREYLRKMQVSHLMTSLIRLYFINKLTKCN